MPEMSSCVPRHALLEPVLGLEGASLLLSEGTKRKGYLVIRAAVRAPPSASWAGGGGGLQVCQEAVVLGQSQSADIAEKMLLLKTENVLEKSFLNSSENAPRSAQSVVSSPDGLND